MMKILVCVKAVPLPESHFRIAPAGDFYGEAGLAFQVNEYDLYALEEAVRIKEKFGGGAGVEISAVTVGSARVEAQLKKAMGLGADHGVRIDDPEAARRDALKLASLLAAWAKDKNFDLVLCGVMSQDLQRGQVGKIPSATAVVALSFSQDRKKITCERELEAGARERVELPLPALLTIQSGINLPRYASLSNVLRVKGMKIPSVPAASLGPVKTSERMVRAYLPEPARNCEFLEGDPGAIADRLLEEIRSRVHLL
jgi:electron transfer flavoprotein beta subunit